MNKYLLETSTLSLLMKNIPEVKGRLNSLTESDYLFTCPIVKGEILFGIARLPEGKDDKIFSKRQMNYLLQFRVNQSRRMLAIPTQM